MEELEESRSWPSWVWRGRGGLPCHGRVIPDWASRCPTRWQRDRGERGYEVLRGERSGRFTDLCVTLAGICRPGVAGRERAKGATRGSVGPRRAGALPALLEARAATRDRRGGRCCPGPGPTRGEGAPRVARAVDPRRSATRRAGGRGPAAEGRQMIWPSGSTAGRDRRRGRPRDGGRGCACQRPRRRP